MSPSEHGPDVTSDHLLGGRVKYTQPRDGFRAALDPVLLAAAIPAQAGDHVLEGGTGAGAALLCLAARVPGVRGTGLDRDPALLALARANAAANGWPGLTFAAADIAACPIRGPVDHAMANPPYHAPGGTRSPRSEREAAKRAVPELVPQWVEALSRPLRPGGTLTLILPPWLLEECLSAMRAARTPAARVFPIRPREGQPARWALIQGRKHGRRPLSLDAGLSLHLASGAFHPEVEAILRNGAALFAAEIGAPRGVLASGRPGGRAAHGEGRDNTVRAIPDDAVDQ